jgi:hypothetical protein
MWTWRVAASICIAMTGSRGQKKKALLGASWFALIWLPYYCLIPRLTAM